MNLAEFHFIRPYGLLLLLPAVVILVLMLRNKLSQGSWVDICDAELLPFLLQEKAVNPSRWPIFIGAVATFLSIIALAGPTWKRLPSPVFRNDAALVIALDLSRSMDAQDIKPSRLTRARYKIADILKHRKDGQTALLVYAGDSFTVTPLTDDVNTIDSQLTALTTDIMPVQGSNTALVLKRAVEMFRRAGLTHGQILLVTDGVDSDNTLSTVKDLGNYQLSILGVGTPDGAPIPESQGGFIKDAQGNIVVPKLNPEALADLAKAGHGLYQTLTPDDTDIQTLSGQFDQSLQQQGLIDANLMLDQWEEKGPWLLLGVLPLAALLFRRGLLSVALLLMLPWPQDSYAFGWQDVWQTRDQQAQEAYNKGDFEKAAELFDDPAWKAAAQYKTDIKEIGENKTPTTETGFYNQGNVFAKLGYSKEEGQEYEQAIANYDQAINSYEQALQLNPGHDDAKFNKAWVEKRKEALEKKQEDQQKDSKQQSGQDHSKSENQKQDEQSKDQQNSQDQDAQPSEQQEKADEHKDREQESQQTQEEKSQEVKDKKPEQTQNPEKESQQAEQIKPDEKTDDKTKPSAPVAASEKPKTESQQANEQWLNRIPDDPAGLLKRKFEYQYKYEYQRKQNRRENNGGW